MRPFRWFIGILSFLPLANMVYRLFFTYDVADPVKFLTKETGVWAIVFMVLTLSITPLRQLTGKPWLFPFRAIFGRFFFMYIFGHAMVFFALANAFNPADIILSIQKSKPIIFGLIAFLMVIPLMATTGHRMIKKLGLAKWKRIHSLIYPASVLGALHYLTVVKKDISTPILVFFIVATLLGVRACKHYLKKT